MLRVVIAGNTGHVCGGDAISVDLPSSTDLDLQIGANHFEEAAGDFVAIKLRQSRFAPEDIEALKAILETHEATPEGAVQALGKLPVFASTIAALAAAGKNALEIYEGLKRLFP